MQSINEQFELLNRTYNSGKTRSMQWRREQLLNAQKMIEDNAALLSEALNKDLGKCQTEVELAETGKILDVIKHSLNHLDKWAKPKKVSSPLLAQPATSYIQPEPLGTVLVIGAWNYPFQLCLEPMLAAISAGNCAIVKPSELSPATSNAIAKLVAQYMDGEAIKVIEGAVEETTELLKLPFDHILYTGGESVGKIVMRAAAEHLTPVTLELGGKSPCVVLPSADLDVAAARIAWGKFMNAGQTCIAPDYILVHRDVKQQLIDKLKHKITAFYGENPKRSEDYGRIVNQRHLSRIVSYLEGQDVIFGGHYDEADNYIAPTLVDEPGFDSPLMQNEIFGPLLPIIAIEDLEQAIQIINSRAKPLALYLFSADAQQQQMLNQQTSCGNLCINDTLIFMANHNLPFGGVGHSGMGGYHGEHGFNTFSHHKAVMKKPFALDSSLRYPPYTDTKLKVLKWLN